MHKSTNKSRFSNKQLNKELLEDLSDVRIERTIISSTTIKLSSKPITKKLIKEIYSYIIENNIDINKLYDKNTKYAKIYVYQDFQSFLCSEFEIHYIYNYSDASEYISPLLLFLLTNKNKSGQTPLEVYHKDILELYNKTIGKEENSIVLKSKYDDIYIVIGLNI